MAKEIKTEVLIHASPEKVWKVLMDFKNYPGWNPFIKSVTGAASVGETINVFIVLPGKKEMELRPKVLGLKENKEFRWKGKLWIKGLFDGEHIFELKDNGNGTTTFIQREKFEGILIPLFTRMLDINTVNGFHLMNQKLKETAECL